MWAQFVGRLSLFISVLFTLAALGFGVIVITEHINMMTYDPVEFWLGIAFGIIGWIIGVVLIYSIAWVLCGKNVFPSRKQT